MATDGRTPARQLDPTGGTPGQAPVIGPSGTVVEWGDAGDASAVHNGGGVPVLSVEGVTVDAPVEGEWRYFPDEDPPAVAAASGELLMQDGVTAPPVPIETEARDDWLYQG